MHHTNSFLYILEMNKEECLRRFIRLRREADKENVLNIIAELQGNRVASKPAISLAKEAALIVLGEQLKKILSKSCLEDIAVPLVAKRIFNVDECFEAISDEALYKEIGISPVSRKKLLNSLNPEIFVAKPPRLAPPVHTEQKSKPKKIENQPIVVEVAAVSESLPVTSATNEEERKEEIVADSSTTPNAVSDDTGPKDLQLISVHAAETKRTYADLLVDRSFQQISRSQEPTVYLLYLLRFRMQLTFKGPTSSRRGASNSRKLAISLYDTLLALLQECDAAGRVEIFRLLLERRCSIPQFLPNGEQHLPLLKLVHKDVGGDVKVCLGEDVALMRVAIISCREKHQSQTIELLNKFFKYRKSSPRRFVERKHNCTTDDG